MAGGNGLGSAANQLYLPQGFYINDQGDIYIADHYNNRIQKWSPGSAQGLTVAGGNSYGSAQNQLNEPHDVAVDASGNIYITDGENNRIQKWAPGALQGETVAGGNGAGNSLTQLNSPFSIALNGNDIFISDRINDRVIRWNQETSTATVVAGGIDGSDSTQLNDPRGIFVTADGMVYIADYFNNRIQKWIPGMHYGITVAGSLSPGKSAARLSNPSGLFVSSNGDLYVADEANNRVQKFTAVNTINSKLVAAQPGTYRAIAIFSNGCRDTSNEIVVSPPTVAATNSTVKSTELLSKPVLAPNPATTYSILNFAIAEAGNYSVEISDIAGRKLNAISLKGLVGQNSVRIETAGFAQGVYVVNIRKATAIVSTFKLMKQ